MNLDIGLNFNHTTNNCFVFSSGSTIRFCNRVCHNAVPTNAEVVAIKLFFGDVPFTWAVDATDSEGITILEKNNLHYKASFPAMILDLYSMCVNFHGDDFVIEEINQNSTDVEKWLMIVSRTFNVSKSELLKVINLFKQRIPSALRIYVGFYQEEAVAAGMTIQHQETVSMHMISTLPEFRKKGFGFAITFKALHDAKNVGCKQAILLSSILGRHIYERVGFKEYALYHMYGN